MGANISYTPQHGYMIYYLLFYSSTEPAEVVRFIKNPNVRDIMEAKVRRKAALPDKLQYILSTATYNNSNDPFIPFFWHVPKAAGSYVRNVCHDGYMLRPHIDLGQPDKMNMLSHRMNGQSKSAKDVSDAKKQCKKYILSGILKSKFLKSCIAKESLSKPEHTCLPECLGFLQTPLLYEANKVFAKTHKKARIATVLRDPVERFISLYTYLQTATWEPTYNPLNLTLDEYILSGEYKKSPDNGNWMVCTLSQCGKSNTDPITQEHIDVAKNVLSNMLVGFTDKMPEFFQRLEEYWNIPSHSRHMARKGAMKEKINVQKQPNFDMRILSPEAVITLHNSLSRDIELFLYARSVLWEDQANMFKPS